MRVGIQLYSVRNNMKEDPIKTIRQVIECGYRYLEVANHAANEDPGVGFKVPVDELKKILSDTNSEIVSAHIYPLIPDIMGPILDYFSAIKTKYIVWPMDMFKGYDDAKQKAEAINKVGEMCKKCGMQLLYHNHFHEFQKFQGKTVLDILMDDTDPELMKLELDTYWTLRAGISPVDVLKKYGKRVPLIHQKDFPKGFDDKIDLLSQIKENQSIDMDVFRNMVDEKTFTEIGTGIMDIQSIINVGNEVCGSEYIILEQDYTQMPSEIDSIKKSMESFKHFSNIEW